MNLPPEAADVRYVLDAEDRIVEVAPHWEEFGRKNAAPDATLHPLGRLLWDFISDPTTRQLYQAMVRRARGGERVRVPYRCDAPDRRRFMELRIEAAPSGSVEFRSRLLRLEPRDPVLLLDASLPRVDRPQIRTCSWCKQMEVEGEWVEVEEGIRRLDLFDAAELPPISHGICPGCEADVMG